MRVPYEELYQSLLRVLLKEGFEEERGKLCARLFTDASRDGVASHGLNRFPRFIGTVRSGLVDLHARPERLVSFGALERWDGKRGVGNLNAYECMNRAIELCSAHGVGCVALANTNHWMRAGNYGWQAAEAGVIGICWSNTMPNLPPWGVKDARLGNNPLVIAVPRPQGHVVLDMAMSQFSYGALASYRMRGESLPVAGGYDDEGQLTRDPAAIEASGRVLPIGYWKGSGLALLLDLLAALLSGGQATYQVPPDLDLETRLSQVFIALNLPAINEAEAANRMADEIIEHLQVSPVSEEGKARYPGERTLELREQNLREGIPVEPSIWQQVQSLC
jgi:3-dehydro-L-gulonate 2-dehydrogenase